MIFLMHNFTINNIHLYHRINSINYKNTVFNKRVPDFVSTLYIAIVILFLFQTKTKSKSKEKSFLGPFNSKAKTITLHIEGMKSQVVFLFGTFLCE